MKFNILWGESVNIEIVTIDEGIKIIRLSYQKLGLPETIESLGKMWDIYGEKYRHKVKNAVMPLMDFGVNDCLLTNKHEYITGCAVTEINVLDEDWNSFVMPPGKYIKNVCHKIDDLFKDQANIKVWAETNRIKLNDNFIIEVYPVGAFEGKDVEIYTLYPIQT